MIVRIQPVAASDDIVYPNGHYNYCMSVEPQGVAWWVAGCFIYNPAPTVAFGLIAVMSVTAMASKVRSRWAA